MRGMSTTINRLDLSLLGLGGETLGSGVLLAHDHDKQPFLTLSNNGFGPKRLAKRSSADKI